MSLRLPHLTRAGRAHAIVRASTPTRRPRSPHESPYGSRTQINLTAEIIRLGGESGGGGGAIGFGAIGGAGGAKYVLDIPSGDLFRSDLAEQPEGAPASPEIVVIGTGKSEGFDGQPGGTTAIGTHEQVLLAAGGGGGGLAGWRAQATASPRRACAFPPSGLSM
jgi:hypothetical protein